MILLGKRLDHVTLTGFFYFMILYRYRYIVSINEDGLLIDDQGYLNGYLTEEQLFNFKTAIDKTIKFYKKNKLDDVKIKRISKEIDTERESLQREEEKKILKEEEEYGKKVRVTDLYLIHDLDSNTLKIGHSKNCKSRLQQLQIATSHRLELLFVLKGEGYLEKDYHERYCYLKIKSEWFINDGEIISHFKIIEGVHNDNG